MLLQAPRVSVKLRHRESCFAGALAAYLPAYPERGYRELKKFTEFREKAKAVPAPQFPTPQLEQVWPWIPVC
jgi:hypothetical protein